MEAKGSKFASFYFLFISFYFPESGLFKGLRPKEIKKILCLVARAAGCRLERFKQRCGLLSPGEWSGRVDSDSENMNKAHF